MPTTKYNRYSLLELETLLDEWLAREKSEQEPDFRQEMKQLVDVEASNDSLLERMGEK